MATLLDTSSAPASHPPIPLFYRAIFLYIEPLMVTWAAFMGYYKPLELLSMLTRKTHDLKQPAPTIQMIHQLSNEYLLVAVLQATVLRCTSERRVWKCFLACLLLADWVHFLNLGLDSIGFGLSEGVLIGMGMVRVLFLLDYRS